MSRSKSRSALLYEWVHGKERYRLIAKADSTPGYEDEYVIESLDADSLGEPRWTRLIEWRAAPNDSATWLVGAIKSLLADQRERGVA